MTSLAQSALAQGHGPCAGGDLTLADLMALPAVTDVVTAGKALGIGRTKSYQLAPAGGFPCRVIRTGKIYRVPTADLLALLGLSPPWADPPAAGYHSGDPMPAAEAHLPGSCDPSGGLAGDLEDVAGDTAF